MDSTVSSEIVEVHINSVSCEGAGLQPSKSYRLRISTLSGKPPTVFQDVKSPRVKFVAGKIVWKLPFGGRFTLSSIAQGLEVEISLRRSRCIGPSGKLIGSCIFECSSPCNDKEVAVVINATISHKSLGSDIDELAATAAQLSFSPHLGGQYSSAGAVAFVSAAGSWKVLLDRLERIMTAMNTITEVFPWVKLAWGVVSMPYKIIQAQVAMDDNIKRLIDTMADFCAFASDWEDLTNLSNARNTIICLIMQQIFDCTTFVRAYYKDGPFRTRVLKNIISSANQRIQEYIDNFTSLRLRLREDSIKDTACMVIRVMDSVSDINNVVNDIDAREILHDLPYAGEARRNIDKQCLPQTRTEVIDAIVYWATEVDAPVSDTSDWEGVKFTSDSRILWVCGVSGSGKSTIARSVAARLEALGRLGSFYAFDRSHPKETNSNTLFSTIARDLADGDPIWRQRLLSGIKLKTSMRKSPNCHEQFQNLIVAPSTGLCAIGNTIIVVDAFDECGPIADRAEVLSILTERANELPDNVRMIVTSRFEFDVQAALEEASRPRSVQLLLLKDVPDILTQRDIEIYIRESLQRALPPAQYLGELEQLVRKAEQSFQWASTACRLITSVDGGDIADPEERVRRILESNDGLDELYRHILDGYFHRSDINAVAQLSTVLGIVIALLEPLPLRALSTLASDDAELSDITLRKSQRYFRLLGSVIDGAHTLDAPITPLHTSFADFLQDPSRSGKYWADPLYIHDLLARHCLREMRLGLKFNICDLPTSFRRNRDVGDIARLVQTHISPALSYACRFWAYHIGKLQVVNEAICGGILALLQESFLEWLEVMSLLSSAPQNALSLLADLKIPVSDVTSYIEDASQFTSTFAVPIAESAPHVYLSAVVFTPPESLVFRHFPPLRYDIRMRGGRAFHWDNVPKLEGHTASVRSVTFSPDGRRIASGSNDGTIRLWDAQTGTAIYPEPLLGSSGSVNSIAFSPSGSQLGSGYQDSSIGLWSMLHNPPTCKRIQGHTRAVNVIAFGHDGAKIVSGSSDCTIRFWDASTGEFLGAWKERNEVVAIAVSFNGAWIASGAKDEPVRIWDANDGKISQTLQGTESSVHSLAFSPNVEELIIGSSRSERPLELRDAKTGVVLTTFIRRGGSVQAAAFSTDGKLVTIGGSDRHVHIWALREHPQSVRSVLKGHNFGVNSVAFSPDGRYIASGSDDQTVRVWTVERGTELLDPEAESLYTPLGYDAPRAPITSIAISPDSSLIAYGHKGRQICINRADTGGYLKSQIFRRLEAFAISFSPNGDSVLFAGVAAATAATVNTTDTANTANTTNTTNTRRARSFEVKHIQDGLGDWSSPEGHIARLVAFAHNGTRILSCTADKHIHTWDAKTGSPLHVLEPYPNSRVSNTLPEISVFSPDGTLIGSASVNKGVDIWDTQTGADVGPSLVGHTEDVTSIVFSADNSRVASGSSDHSICVWDRSTGSMIGEPLRGHKAAIRSLAFSPDGKWIASGSSDSTIRIWDVETGVMVRSPMTGHTDAVTSVAFTSDGAHIASGSDDCTVRMWDICLVDSPSATDPALKTRKKGAWSDYPHLNSELADRGWALRNGWIVDSEDRLILWVPPLYRHDLHGFGTHILFQDIIEFDFSEFKYGEEWQQCRDPPH